MTNDKAAKTELRKKLAEELANIPKQVVQGSYGFVLDWKEAHAEARRALNRPNATLLSLSEALHGLKHFSRK